MSALHGHIKRKQEGASTAEGPTPLLIWLVKGRKTEKKVWQFRRKENDPSELGATDGRAIHGVCMLCRVSAACVDEK